MKRLAKQLDKLVKLLKTEYLFLRDTTVDISERCVL